MKNAELNGLSMEDLTSKLKEEKELLQKLKFAHALSPIENPMRIRVARKYIAQLSTELNARRSQSK
ncbi:MAG: 50S ribosomal protein L29 [Cytophagia bacterium]|nr:MAG: 50S ribosomal protein L29 [Cytophagales bacterium]TAG04838.1 MAG: 50S ribosomal protein L29 [Cytophagia bacterium]TAG43589.1 MAG: 50S ribosomal protein L29 [Cytophagia bacterium]TAH30204.1 MAG: 50S ribosomal protein L29 [Cytophagales bacterium]